MEAQGIMVSDNCQSLHTERYTLNMSELTEAQVDDIRRDFPSLQRQWEGKTLKFFDGPGGSQVPESVISAVSGYYRKSNSNSHGLFVTSRETDEVLAQARTAMTDFLGAPGPETISLGANMTTLNYSLSHALARKFSKGDEILITALDHEANRGPWLGLRECGFTVREIPLDAECRLDYEALEKMMSPRTRLVAVGWASNALGIVNDIARIRDLTRKAGSLMLVDAVHYAPHYAIDVAAADVDFLLCSAYKFYGPHVGILYSRPGLLDSLDPDRLKTQDQQAPFRIETGTLNHAAITGVTAAVEYLAEFGEGTSRREKLVSGMDRISKWEFSLGRKFFETLGRIPGIEIYGPDYPSEPGWRTPTVGFRHNRSEPAEICEYLGEKGFLLWDGDFYAARVIELLGLADRGGVVRAGMSLYTLEKEVDGLLAAVAELAE